MKPTVFVRWFVVIWAVLSVSPSFGQAVTFHGHMFGDYYWVGANHRDDIEGQNAFQFRQIYLTMDFDLNEQWSARLRHEMSSPGNFSAAENLSPNLEDAYVKWATPSHEMTLGLTETPTWGSVEPVWGYRAVEKTLLDLHGIGSARDIGVTLKGRMGTKLRYHMMLANGNAARSETDTGKKIFASLAFTPHETLLIEAYGDFDDRPGMHDRYTVQGFVAYISTHGRLGLQFVHQLRKNPDAANVTMNGVSLFGSLPLKRNVNGFLRLDRLFTPNPNGATISYLPFDPHAKSTLLLGGVEFKVHEQVSLLPNIEAIFYDAGTTTRPDTDIIPRISFHFTF